MHGCGVKIKVRSGVNGKIQTAISTQGSNQGRNAGITLIFFQCWCLCSTRVVRRWAEGLATYLVAARGRKATCIEYGRMTALPLPALAIGLHPRAQPQFGMLSVGARFFGFFLFEARLGPFSIYDELPVASSRGPLQYLLCLLLNFLQATRPLCANISLGHPQRYNRVTKVRI